MSLQSITAHIFDHQFRRKLRALATNCSDGPLKTYFDTEPPRINNSITNTEFLVADLEMTGLDPKKDQILSIGTTLVKNNAVVHTHANHRYLFHSEANLAQSAPIHRILQQDLRTGVETRTVLAEFLNALQGRVLVLHHANLDRRFLNAAIKHRFGSPFLCRTVDTMLLERKRLNAQGKEAHQLGLGSTRERYGLPPYTAHNAAIDALATAELFIAQLSFIDPNGEEPLSTLL